MENYITIGEIIRHYRTERGLSQAALADGICERKYISNIENNRNIPTLDIINQLSDRLQINLYETYALMLRHHDMDTHNKIEILNQCFIPERRKELLLLIEEYENLPGFQYGEPLQIIKYAKSIYLSYVLGQNAKAIAVAFEALSVNKTFQIDDTSATQYLSNVELSLLNAIGVNYCRMNQNEEGKKYFDFLQEYLHQQFSLHHYATNRNNQFELKLLSNVVYNYFIFLREEPDFKPESIEKTLCLLKSLHCHHNLPELLLCRTYLEFKDQHLENAKQTYSLAHQFGLYLYTDAYVTRTEKSVLGKYYGNCSSMSNHSADCS